LRLALAGFRLIDLRDRGGFNKQTNKLYEQKASLDRWAAPCRLALRCAHQVSGSCLPLKPVDWHRPGLDLRAAIAPPWMLLAAAALPPTQSSGGLPPYPSHPASPFLPPPLQMRLQISLKAFHSMCADCGLLVLHLFTCVPVAQ